MDSRVKMDCHDLSCAKARNDGICALPLESARNDREMAVLKKWILGGSLGGRLMADIAPPLL